MLDGYDRFLHYIKFIVREKRKNGKTESTRARGNTELQQHIEVWVSMLPWLGVVRRGYSQPVKLTS